MEIVLLLIALIAIMIYTHHKKIRIPWYAWVLIILVIIIILAPALLLMLSIGTVYWFLG